MGWAGVKNNQLLALAEAEFDVFIRNLGLKPRPSRTALQRFYIE
jgi:hypothetical protein